MNEFADHEWLSFDLVELVRNKSIDADAQVSAELSEVLLCNDHFLVALQHFSGVTWQWIDVLELCKRNAMSAFLEFLHS